MRIIETNVYEFDELSEEGKEKAISNLSDINVDFEWYEDDYLLDLGLSKRLVNRLSKEQGEVLFKWNKLYFDLDRDRYIQFIDLEVTNDDIFRQFLKIPKKLWNRLYYSFYNKNNYNNNIELVLDLDNNYNDLTEKQNKIIDNAIEIFSSLVWNSLKELTNWYEELTSERSIIETIKLNEYEFTIEGDLV